MKNLPFLPTTKKAFKKYSHVPVKDAEEIPWHSLAEDIVCLH